VARAQGWAWTADGRYFFFEGNDAEHPSQFNLWAMCEKPGFWHRCSRDPVELTSGPVSFQYPVAGKDAKRLFALGCEANNREWVRYDMKTRRFDHYDGDHFPVGSQFSLDGQWVTYAGSGGHL
jgi:hypothetical protein